LLEEVPPPKRCEIGEATWSGGKTRNIAAVVQWQQLGSHGFGERMTKVSCFRKRIIEHSPPDSGGIINV
jgi:hypothetical protein